VEILCLVAHHVVLKLVQAVIPRLRPLKRQPRSGIALSLVRKPRWPHIVRWSQHITHDTHHSTKDASRIYLKRSCNMRLLGLLDQSGPRQCTGSDAPALGEPALVQGRNTLLGRLRTSLAVAVQTKASLMHAYVLRNAPRGRK